MRQWFLKILFIALLNRWIFMRESKIIVLIKPIQNVTTLFNHPGVFLVRLSAAVDTAARTGHNFNEIIVNLALLNSIHQTSCVAKSAGNSYIYSCSIKVK